MSTEVIEAPRRKPGRPRTSSEEAARLEIQCPADMIKAIDEAATRKGGISRAAWIRLALHNQLRLDRMEQQ